MAISRNFLFSSGAREQSVAANNMGRILEMPQAHEVVEQFGSKFIKRPGDYMAYIEPRLPRKKLEKLGQALVDFALQLDDTPPEPTYTIQYVEDKR